MGIHSFHHQVSNVESFKKLLEHKCQRDSVKLVSFSEEEDGSLMFNCHFELEGDDAAVAKIAGELTDIHE